MADLHQPFFEGDFGQGKVLLLSDQHLQWLSPQKKDSVRFDIPTIEKLELRERPVWESLLIPLVASVVWLTHFLWLKLAWVLLLIWGVSACLLQRRYSLGVTLKTGDKRKIFLNFGRKNTPPVQRTLSIWESLLPELSRLSVDARPR